MSWYNGFGLRLSRRLDIGALILDEVYEQWLGKKYADEEAAIEILGGPDKKPLTKTKSPFLHLFEYGENRDGYWNYSNMVIQFDDAVDVLQVMHPTFEFVFLFDHSSGHAKQRPDGLNHHRMNRTFGGKANRMRDTIIECEEHTFKFLPVVSVSCVCPSSVFSTLDKCNLLSTQP